MSSIHGKQLYNYGADKGQGKGTQEELLCAATRNKQYRGMKLLVENRADVNGRGYNGSTALGIAIKGNDTKGVRLLLNLKADVNSPAVGKKTPLDLALQTPQPRGAHIYRESCERRWISSCQMRFPRYCHTHSEQKLDFKDGLLAVLLQGGADVEQAWDAIIDAELSDCALVCLKYERESTRRKDKGWEDKEHPLGGNPLLTACAQRDTQAIDDCLKRCDINSQDKLGLAPLHRASALGDTEVVKFLLQQRGILVDKQDHMGMTALIWGARQGHTEIVKLLLQNEADPNQQNAAKVTALLWAAYNGHIDVVEALLKKGANINHLDRDHASALDRAAATDNEPLLELLLKESRPFLAEYALLPALRKGRGVATRALLKYHIETLIENRDDKLAMWRERAVNFAERKAKDVDYGRCLVAQEESEKEGSLNQLIPFVEAGLIQRGKYGEVADKACEVVTNASLLREYAERNNIPLDLLTMIFSFAGSAFVFAKHSSPKLPLRGDGTSRRLGSSPSSHP